MGDRVFGCHNHARTSIYEPSINRESVMKRSGAWSEQCTIFVMRKNGVVGLVPPASA